MVEKVRDGCEGEGERGRATLKDSDREAGCT